jgi:hypothetical protein
VNWKGYGRKPSCSSSRDYPTFSWKDRGKPLKTLVKIDGVRAGISKIRGRSIVAERNGKLQDSERSDKKHSPN